MSKTVLTNKLGMIGGGRMAEALISGVLSAKLYRPDQIWVADPDAGRLDHLNTRYGVQVGGTNHEVVGLSDVVVLAVKPQVMADAVRGVSDMVTKQLVISVAAGVKICRIMEACGADTRLIRAMPNMPAMVGEGITALAVGPKIEEDAIQCARQIFESVGRVVLIDERLMDAVTGLSGSGPAYVFLMIEAMTDGGVKMGLPRETASLLAAQTVVGAARMVLETGQHPAGLKDQVASPGGTTIAGLHRLEQGGVRAVVIDAIEAATKRSQELGG
ncbi:MAG: pyrroline-5-carboxylate reductase [Nitrospira sp.]|nr:pyrroline-5-carboxylate reductase [Nitrospira sp.]MDH4369964.1 pyrroline-5-carboxylate reductase [Nitrospira sp.]MDH5348027.1 pyrroline-5-carboxylate reductase [Nitrospira sp.]MDH5498254.1 pyrroline-5-carboxylate reductase [Nitrospira sp.]MDH5724906.1 pyrroline-5-carboxylate reductase [Nitrospira sp.]